MRRLLPIIARSLLHYLVTVLLLVATGALFAGTVSRPTKTCGTTQYVSELAAGCPTIKSSEVDADLNALVTGVNNIETANVNVAGLGTAAYANLSVTGAKIADTTITSGKLAVGGSVNASQTANVTTGLSFSSVETTIVTLPSITVRGGPVFLSGFIGWNIRSFVTASGTELLTIRIKRAGSTIRTVTFPNSSHDTNGDVFPIPSPAFTDTPPAGSYVYTITAQTTDSDMQVETAGTNAGLFQAMELS